MITTLSFDGRTVAITGCATGIGAATARSVVALGGHVVAVDRDATALTALAEELGPGVTPLVVDVTDPAAPEAVLEAVGATPFALHALVSNVGINPKARLLDLTDEAWTTGLDLNLGSAVRIVRTLLPRLLEAPGGNLVTVSSVHGVVGQPSSAVYASAKAALIGLTRQLCAEHASAGLRANVVCPGLTLTERIIARGTFPAQEALRERLLSQRFAETQEVADVIVYIASDAASYVSGVVLPVDGGFTAH